MSDPQNPYAPPTADEVIAIDHGGFSYESAAGSAGALKVLLGICLITAAVGLVSSGLQIGLLGRMDGGGDWTMDEAKANDFREGSIAIIHALTVLIAGVVWFVWQSRTSKNVRALGAENMEFGPNAWGWFFCPIINLWRPLQVMRELWVVSAPEPSGDSLTQPAVFNLWWAGWIASGVLTQVSLRMVGDGAELGTAIVASWIDMLATVGTLVSGWAAIKMIGALQARVEARHARRTARA